MTLPFIEENAASRQRLEAFLGGLSDEDLARATPYAGTVAALIAHLALWDQRVLVLLRRWKAQGYVDESPVDADMINDAVNPILLALEPRAAVALCLASAAAVDAELEMLSAEFVREIEAAPVYIRLNRALHRDAHLKDLGELFN